MIYRNRNGERVLDWVGTALLTVSLIALNVALLNSADIQSVSTFNQLLDSETRRRPGRSICWPLVALSSFLFVEQQLGKRQAAESEWFHATAPH